MPDAGPTPRRERAINIPGLLLGWIALLIAIQAARGWLGDMTELRLLVDYAFIPAPWSILTGVATADEVIRSAETSSLDPQLAEARVALARYLASQNAQSWSWLSYGFLHGSWTHVVLNCVWLAAFGSPVVARVGAARSLLLGVATSLGGAVAQWAADPMSVQPVIGASAIVSGFMAAAATFIFAPPQPFWRTHEPPRRWAFLQSRNALIFLGLWLAANLLFGVLAGPLGLVDGSVAWQAHIGGLLVGLVMFPFIDPGPRSLRGQDRAA